MRASAYAHESDQDLLKRYADGNDGTAFEEIVRRHGPLVLARCREMLRDKHEAEDAFQEVFLALTRRVQAGTEINYLAAYLFQAAFRVARRMRAQSARRPKAVLAQEVPAPRPVIGNPTARPARTSSISSSVVRGVATTSGTTR